MRGAPFLIGAGLAAAASLASAQTPPASTPATVTAAPASAGAYLNITPKRLTFDRARRNGQVFLLNQGSDPVTVDVALTDRVMTPDGQIQSLEDAARTEAGRASATALKSALEMVQVSPRRVTLLPGRPQTVRVRLSTLPEDAKGEFRTHLTVTTLPPRDAGATAEAAAAGATPQLSFQVTAVYGLSIPVIVRPQEPEVAATLAGARVEMVQTTGQAKPTPVLVLDVVRGGASSVYGNLEVRAAGARRDSEALGVVRGVGVYPEIARRAVRIPLNRAPQPGETLEVTLTDDDTSPGKVLAKATL